jgi:predicted nucleic acid-binding protein
VARRSAERARLALDTNCLIALVCGWHEHHEAIASAVERRLDAGARLALAAPALLEAYAVLTRLPPPHRLLPADALHVLEANFGTDTRTVTLDADEYWSLLRVGPTMGVYGGRIYDAVIAACARKSNARELLTLNLKHFESFADASLLITSPAP